MSSETQYGIRAELAEVFADQARLVQQMEAQRPMERAEFLQRTMTLQKRVVSLFEQAGVPDVYLPRR